MFSGEMWSGCCPTRNGADHLNLTPPLLKEIKSLIQYCPR